MNGLSQGTISIWFKLDTIPDAPDIHPLFSYGTDSAASFLDRVIIEVGHFSDPMNTKLYFTLGNPVVSVPTLCYDSGPIMEAGEWYHFVAVVGPDFNTGYLNGREMTDRHYNFGNANDSEFFDDVFDTSALWIGKAPFSNQMRYFDGIIDEVRIYDRPLSGLDVRELYSQDLAVGDMNGSTSAGEPNGNDINPFVMALVDRPAYEAAYPHIDADIVGDCNEMGDGLNGNDINPFVARLIGSSQSIPEPATMGLLAMGACLPLFRRKRW